MIKEKYAIFGRDYITGSKSGSHPNFVFKTLKNEDRT